MNLNWSCGGLANGLRCYRAEEFFEAHEHWEAVWLASEEPEKTFLQALIQTSAAFHHLRRRNGVGASSLLTRALRKLDSYPAVYGGVEVEELRASMRGWLRALEGGDGSAGQLPFPRIG